MKIDTPWVVLNDTAGDRGEHRRRRNGAGDSSSVGWIDLVFHAEALAFDDDGLGAVQDAVQDRRGHAGVVVEDLRPALEGLVGRDDEGAAFVARADDLEEQVGPDFVEGQIAELVDSCGAPHESTHVKWSKMWSCKGAFPSGNPPPEGPTPHN